eukprot:1184557-Rhodomonas_salina.1
MGDVTGEWALSFTARVEQKSLYVAGSLRLAVACGLYRASTTFLLLSIDQQVLELSDLWQTNIGCHTVVLQPKTLGVGYVQHWHTACIHHWDPHLYPILPRDIWSPVPDANGDATRIGQGEWPGADTDTWSRASATARALMLLLQQLQHERARVSESERARVSERERAHSKECERANERERKRADN